MKLLSIATAAIGIAIASHAIAEDTAIPKQERNDALHDRLPEAIRAAGKMTSVNNGSFPPYELVTGTEMDGASADLTHALGEILGVEIDHATVGGACPRFCPA